MKSEKRKRQQAMKLARKGAQHVPGGHSLYARKRKYLDREGGWGFSYPEPKPWK